MSKCVKVTLLHISHHCGIEVMIISDALMQEPYYCPNCGERLLPENFSTEEGKITEGGRLIRIGHSAHLPDSLTRHLGVKVTYKEV